MMDKQLFEHVLAAADRLNDKHQEAMLATGQGFDFLVTHNVSTDRIGILLGPYLLWDDEDENDGKFDADSIVAYAQEQLNDLANTLHACAMTAESEE